MEEIVTLINRAQSGDAEAYGVLVGRFQDMAYGYAYAILSDFHLAQDAAQEAFIEAYQCLPGLREDYAFPSWLKRIVHKHCDRLTRRKHLATTPLDAAVEVASPQPGPAEVAEKHELAQRVQDAIRNLPDQQRVVTTLFYINGYSHQDIAEFLEVHAKTVKSRLHASRSRLRERMIDMVEDELKANRLPTEFTQETVEQAVARAKDLNKEGKHNEAEELLRQVMTKAPEDPDVLKELNKSVAQGRVYGQGRFDMLPELAEYGRIILRTTDDEYMHQQLAKTLLAIPAMPEAVTFIEEWIAKKGPSLERIGMLAWARGCVAEYEAAEKLWNDLLALAKNAEPDEILRNVPFAAYTLVDCFAAVPRKAELPRAQRVAREAWEFCGRLGVAKGADYFGDDAGWLLTFRTADLDLYEITPVLLARHGSADDARTRAYRLAIRSWTDDSETISAEWLSWVRERVVADEWALFVDFRWVIGRGLRAQGEWRAANKLAQDIWDLLRRTGTRESEGQMPFWDVRRFDVNGAIAAEDWAAAEALARSSTSMGDAWWLIRIAAIRGMPTPSEVVEAVEKDGVGSVDKYGMYGWYVIAREAAAAGDEAKAFDALRKAVSYWTNSPYGCATDMFEADAYWGELRNHPEFKAAFDERRRRIGPVYGQLHYFPGW